MMPNVLRFMSTNIAGPEKVSICVRNTDLKSLELYEEFLQFILITDTYRKTYT